MSTKNFPNLPNKRGEIPLHFAVDSEDFELVNLLLDFKANPGFPSSEGETPLHYAATTRNSQIIGLLLSKGSNPNRKANELGRSPFHYAAIVGCEECLRLLITYGADSFLEDNQGNKPIDLAEPEAARIIEQIEMVTIIDREPETEECVKLSDLDVLYDFLASIGLEMYYDTLVKAGFDDLASR